MSSSTPVKGRYEVAMGVPEGASGASADAPVVGLGMVLVSNSLKKIFQKKKEKEKYDRKRNK